MTRVIADYTQFDYQQSFWAGKNREYEDFCDRSALRKLLPKTGQKLADICGGYGRLVPEYLTRFKQVYLFDYAQNLLAQAKKEYGQKINIQQGSIYALPYAENEFDVCILVRASHHLKDFPAALDQLRRILRPQGLLILEIANKRNILEIVRWALGRSKMRPFDLPPTSRNEKGFYNYHPRYVEVLLKEKNFKIRKTLSVSLFRNELLKKVLGNKILFFLEEHLQSALGWLKLSPSIYYLAEKAHA